MNLKPKHKTVLLKSQLTIPGLQRAAKRECVSCGGAADSFCARCGVTPYCSAQCQRRDWRERHQAVCHNLARLNEVLDVDGEVVIEQPAANSMRRPHSPANPRGQRTDRDDHTENGPKKFPPTSQRDNQGYNNRQGGQNRQGRQDGNSRQEGQGRHEGQNSRQEGQGRHEGQNNRQEGQGRHEGQTSRQGGQNRQQDRPPRQFNVPDMQKPMRRPQVADDDNSSGTGRQYNRQGFAQKNSFAAKRQYLMDRSTIQLPPDDEEESWDAPKTKTPAVRDDQKPSAPQTKNPPAKQQGEFKTNKPPMGGPDSNKTANQNTPSPAKTPIRNATIPQAAAATASPAKNVKPPGDAADATPAKKMVPKHYLIETLSTGDIVLVQVESTAKECEAGENGFVCLSLGESHTEQYQALCESYEQADTAPLTPTPGETVSFKNPEDGAWYRARVLSPTKAALLDSPRIVPLDTDSVLACLPPAYHDVPEYCCLLQAALKVGESYTCTLLEKTGLGFYVSLEAQDGSVIKGEASRWLPAVCYPAPAKPATPRQPVPNANTIPVIPSVPRPPVKNNSTVVLVHTTSGPEAVSQPAELFVRPTDAASQRAYDAALNDTVAYALTPTVTPLTDPPRAGQYVIGKYEDAPYRALVRRTSQAKNKYLLEYLEFGNTHVNQLENLFACPTHLLPEQMPIMTSRVALKQTKTHPITTAAQSYLDALKEETELILTLPNGAATAPSGSEVILTVAKNKENVNSRVEELCTPQWLALQQSGKDIILEVERLSYNSLKYLELERAGGEMTVLDMSTLEQGHVSACLKGHPHHQFVLTQLTERMNAYCDQEKEPYLPAAEELCLAQMPPYTQWFRAAVISHEPGAPRAEICYIDYGNMDSVPVALLRKMLPEFVEGIPALASTLFIKGFPKNPTADQLMRAAEFMQMNEEGQGTLTVTNCEMMDGELCGMYNVEAPALLQAMGL